MGWSPTSSSTDENMDSLKYAMYGTRILDPSRIVILRPSTCEIKELTPEEKKLKSLRYVRDKYDDKYGDFIIYALIALLSVMVNALLQGIPLVFKYPILIPMYLSIPVGVYLIGVIFLLYSKYLDRKISKLMESKPKRS